MITEDDIKYELIGVDKHGIANVRYYVEGGKQFTVGFAPQTNPPSDDELIARKPIDVFGAHLRESRNIKLSKVSDDFKAKSQAEFDAKQNEEYLKKETALENRIVARVLQQINKGK